MGKLRVGAANHHWFADSLDVWSHGANLGTVDRPDKGGNILVPGELAEREHTSRVGRLIIFDDELNWSPEHTACFVHLFSSELCALTLVKTGFSKGSSERSHHADFERLCCAPKTGEHAQHTG